MRVQRKIFKQPGILYRLGRIRKKTLLDALACLINITTLEQLALNGEDWRTLVGRVATHSAISEEDLLETIGRLLKISVMQRIRPVDPIVRDHIPSLDTLRYHGLIPLVAEGIVAGYACIDPNRALHVLPDIERQQLYLAQWKHIETALTETEKIFNAEQEKIAQLQKSLLQKKVYAAIANIIDQAAAYGCSSVQLRIEVDAVRYNFKLLDGRKGQGVIAETLRNELLALVQQMAAAPEGTYIESVDRRVAVQILSPFECFKIDWKDTDTGTAESVTGVSNCVVSSIRPAACSTDPLPCTVLVVEDNQSFAKVLRCFFSTYQITAVFAESGAEALDLLDNGLAPDAIICDVHMPVMNGYEFVDRLRQRERFMQLPVLMLTSDLDIETELTFVSYGVEAFLAKSDDPRLLIGHLRRVISRRAFERTTHSKQAA